MQHIYENVPILGINYSSLDHNTIDHSRSETTENYPNQSTVQNNVKHLNNNNHQLSINENHTATKESNPSPNIISVKEGDLTVRKGIHLLNEKQNLFESLIFIIFRFYNFIAFIKKSV